MVRLKKNLIFRVLGVVCVFMQFAAILPHHHHEGSTAPCINLMHCISDCNDAVASAHPHCGCDCAHGDDGPAADSHRHDTGDPECRFNHIDLISMREQHEQAGVFVAGDMPALPVYHLCTSQCVEGSRCEVALSSSECFRQRDDGPLHIAYITAAIPPRAPSFTA